jgi:hypothetical protein
MRRQYRKQWMRWHKGYESYANVKFKRMFKKIALNIPLEILSESNYTDVLNEFIPVNSFNQSFKEVYKDIGLIHGERTGKQINQQIKAIGLKFFTLDDFISLFERNIISFLLEGGGSRIVSVRTSYISFINEIIATGINDNKTMSQITTSLDKMFNSRKWYRWQSSRIARTETTTAANLAALTSSEVSGFEMQKEWISAIDNRTRRGIKSKFNHYDMNGVRVDLNQDFNVSGEKMMFPGDIKGSAGNVINCRCTVAQIPKRDSKGRLIRKK